MILAEIAQGDARAADQLLPLVYDELRKLAAARLARESPGQTLDAAALVHEAYLRLVGPAEGECWDNRGHFFAAAATAMRRILIERARRKQRIVHGGDRQRQELHADLIAAPAPNDELLDLDAALTKFAERYRVNAQLVDCVFSRASPAIRRRKSWASRVKPPIATGFLRGPGCSAKWMAPRPPNKISPNE